MRIEPYGQPLSGIYPTVNKPQTMPFELPSETKTESAGKPDALEKLRLLLEERRIENNAQSDPGSPLDLGQLIDLRV